MRDGILVGGGEMAAVRVAAVQASYVLMDQAATLDRVAGLTARAAARGAQLVAFPEAFVPGTPIWIDTRPIWGGDEDWFRLLAENAVVVPGPACERLGAIASENGVWLVVGTEERDQHGGTIYDTVLYFSPGARWRAGTENSSRPDRSGRCGGWATGRRCAWSTRRSAGSAG
jgi:nitrilase